MSTELAIIIPAKNEEDNIVTLLCSIGLQDYSLIRYIKIYLADANSTDSTVKSCVRAAEILDLDLKVITGGLPSVGRNNGAFAAWLDLSYKYYLFLDSDVVFMDKTFIRRVISEMDKKNLDCVTTDIHTSGDLKSKVLYFLNNICQRLSRLLGIPYSTGMCMAMRSRTFWELGGFDEDMRFGEDFELSKKVNPSRFRVIKGGVLTSDRRFKHTGYWKMIKMCVKTALGYKVWDENYWEGK
jgi:glycosyltransferase involved in cell wall biosynthesis